LIAAPCIALALLACDRGDVPAGPSSSARSEARTEAAAASVTLEDPVFPGFGGTSLEARPGQLVLAPGKASLETALSHKWSRTALSFYSGSLIESGAQSSSISFVVGQRARIPNALVIPLPPEERVSAGDFVLTSWGSGAGMQRAWVVSAADPLRPRVRYLDVPSDAAAEAEALAPGAFRRIREPGDVGASVACPDGQSRAQFMMLARQNETVLVLGYGGTLSTFSGKDCERLPFATPLKRGDSVMVPALGRFMGAVVSKAPAAGRVEVTRDDGRSSIVPLLDVLLKRVAGSNH
jgi:hypothetical protein